MASQTTVPSDGRDRAQLIGARFEVRSRPSEGTVVWLAIPVGTVRR